MVDVALVVADLVDESEVLDGLVAGLDRAEWRTPTPAPGWTIAHQIAHLAWTDDIALLSAANPVAFAAELRDGLAGVASVPEYVEQVAGEGARTEPEELLRRWRTGRERLAQALRELPRDVKLPWLGPSMSPSSMATARLMETWAHGQDVADALGVVREPTARLRHVAHIAVRARAYAFAVNDRPVPADDVRVELVAPDGEMWTWGEITAANRVTGSAVDFCFLATQRRHRDDLDVNGVGPVADEWLGIAQAFAGPPGAGRRPAGAMDDAGFAQNGRQT